MIRDCLEEPITLDDLATEVDLSPWHTLRAFRAFRAAFGETPKEFHTRLRLSRAKHLLTITNRSVTDVCFDVGFTSLGTFSTLFRKKIGYSPNEFRKQVRGWVTVPGRYPWAMIPFCFAYRFGPG